MFRYLKTLNSQLQMVRKRVAQQERERLQLNYNKMPNEVRYLTATEKELKQELI